MLSIIWSMLKLVFGYALQWYRSRPKVVLTTHGSSWSGRGIQMSITNHGKTPVIVRSWSVHIKMELPPELDEIVRQYTQQQSRRTDRPARFSDYINRLLDKWDRRAKAHALRAALAQAMLKGLHWRYELLEPGTTQRIEPGESTACVFPRTGTSLSDPFMPVNSSRIIIPSCHVVGHRASVWGLPSGIASDDDGTISSVFRMTQPDMDDED